MILTFIFLCICCRIFLRGVGGGGAEGGRRSEADLRQMVVTYSLLASDTLEMMGGDLDLGEVPEELHEILQKFSLDAEEEETLLMSRDSDAPAADGDQEEEEKDIFRRADEDEVPQYAGGPDLFEYHSGEVEVLEARGLEYGAMEEEARPAELIPGKDLDHFQVVWQHPRVDLGPSSEEEADPSSGDPSGPADPSDVSVLKSSRSAAYGELLLALKELVRDAKTKVKNESPQNQGEVPLSALYAKNDLKKNKNKNKNKSKQDIKEKKKGKDSVSAVLTLDLLEELDRSRKEVEEAGGLLSREEEDQLASQRGEEDLAQNQLVVSYRRLSVDKMSRLDPFEGVYYGNYGVHGTELLELRRQMLVEDDGTWQEYVVATKLTGDPNVPVGKVSFKAKISKSNRVSFSTSAAQSWQFHKQYRYPEELQVQHLYKGSGQVAGEGFVNPRWTEGELLVLSPKSIIGDGAPLAFVFCMQDDDDLEEDEDEDGVGFDEDEEEEEEGGSGGRFLSQNPIGAAGGRTRKVVILLHKLDLEMKKKEVA